MASYSTTVGGLEPKELFLEKSVEELSAYLNANMIPPETCTTFEEEEVDGQAFMDLTEDDIKSLGKKIGVIKKLCRLQKSIIQQEQPSQLTSPPRTPVSDRGSSTADQSQPWDVSPSMSPSPAFPKPSERESPFSPRSQASDDNLSISSSASSMLKRETLVIPDTWRPTIMDCLKSPTIEARKIALTHSLRQEIVRDLVTQMFAVNPKPNSEFASQVARKLVRKYPFMKDVGDKATGYGSWEKRIIERINNSKARKRSIIQRDGCDPPSTSPKRGRPKISAIMGRYPSIQLNYADESTIQRDLAKLKQEVHKSNPSKSVVVPLMKQTFSHTREFILSGLDCLSTILQLHPELKLLYGLEVEMELIMNQQDIFRVATRKWASLVPAIIQHSTTLAGKMGDTIKKIQEDYKDEDDEQLAFRMLLLLLVKKDIKKVKSNVDPTIYVYEVCKVTDSPDEIALALPKRTAPRFASFGEDFFLFIEDIVVCQTSSFGKMLCTWFSSHYVLNLEYCKQVKDFCLFLQEFMFNMPDTSKKSATYLTVSSDICKYIH